MTISIAFGFIYLMPRLLLSPSSLGIACCGVAIIVTQACAIGIATVDTVRNTEQLKQHLQHAAILLASAKRQLDEQQNVITNLHREVQTLTTRGDL